MGDHLIVLHSAVRACAGYSRHGTLEEAIAAAAFALSAAGLPKGICRQARAACEDYFYSRLDLTPGYELGGRGEIVEPLELMPEPMYRALEDVVGLVVDGEYDDLRDLWRSAQSRGPAPSRRGGLPRGAGAPTARDLRGRGDHQV